eukprot:scaffold39861_cov161-Skeletonema_dohrnii-CCMP3373.AAC.2
MLNKLGSDSERSEGSPLVGLSGGGHARDAAAGMPQHATCNTISFSYLSLEELMPVTLVDSL